MTTKPDLAAIAAKYYDIDEREILDASGISPLTAEQRAGMIATVLRIDGMPCDSHRSDGFVSGMYLHSLQRELRIEAERQKRQAAIERGEQRLAKYESEQAAKRQAAEAKASADKVQRELAAERQRIEHERKAREDWLQGYRDGERHAAERAAAARSLAEVREVIAAIKRDVHDDTDEQKIKEAAEAARARRYRS